MAGELFGDGVEAERGVDRLLREMGDGGDAARVDDAHEQLVGAEVHRDDALGLGVGLEWSHAQALRSKHAWKTAGKRPSPPCGERVG